MKKLIYLLLCFLGICIPKETMAEAFYMKGFYYEILDEDPSTVRIYAYDSDDLGDEEKIDLIITSPITYEGNEYIVKVLGQNCLAGFERLNSLEIPGSVVEIEHGAFPGCTNLKNVIIGESVTHIGDQAFYECNALTSMTIKAAAPPRCDENTFDGFNTRNCKLTVPDGSVQIYKNSESWSKFNYSNYLDPQDFIYNGIKYTILNESQKICKTKDGYVELNYMNEVMGYYPEHEVEGDLIIPSHVYNDGQEFTVVFVGNASFCGSNITSLELPETVTEIGDYAFSGCEKLGSIKFPSSLKIINNKVFYGCKSLLSVDIPDNVTEMKESVFENCSGMKSIKLSNSLKVISAFLCKNCISLESIKIPDSVIKIGSKGGGSDSCFEGCISLTSVEIPNSVISIGYSSFEGCANLKSIVIPNSVVSMDYSVFKNCTSLTDVKLSENLITIPPSMFYGCTSLESIEFPEGIKYINGYVLEDCLNLKYVVFPSTLQDIGNMSLKNCTSLTEIKCYAVNPPSCYSNLFDGVYLGHSTLYVPVGSKSLYQEATAWKGFGIIEDNLEIQAKEINLSYNKINLKENESFLLRAYVSPTYTTDSVVWYSSDENIAIVSQDGLVQAISEGAAIITASCGNVSATCDVTVIPVTPQIGDSFILGNLRFSVINIVDKQVSVVGFVENEENVVIPNDVSYLNETFKVSRVGYGAFNGCTNLRNVELTEGIIEISNQAFINCENINSIVSFATTPPVIYSETFPASIYQTAKVTVPEQSLKSYTRDNLWGRFQNYLTLDNTASLSHYEIEMAGDEVFQLGVFNYDGDVEWSSSNPEIAYVNDCGLVVAMGPTGSLQITAKTANENLNCRVIISTPYRGERIAQEVKTRVVSSTDMEDIDPTELSIESINYDKRMVNLRLFPIGASSVIDWTSSDESIASIDKGIITVYETGIVEVGVETENGIEGNVEIDTRSFDPAGIEEIFGDNEKFMPVNVYDISGRIVYFNATNEQINNLEKGLYIIKGKKILIK